MPFTYTLQFLGNSFPHIPFPHISLLHTFNVLSSTFPLLLHSPIYHTAILTATFPYYGSISPFIPFIPSPYYNPPIVPPFLSPLPFSPCFPLFPGFPWFFGAFRLVPLALSRSGRSLGAFGSACLLAAVRASVLPSSAVPLVLLCGPCVVLLCFLPFCACSGSGAPLFRACLFRARELGRIGNKKRSGGACSASSLLGLYFIFRASFHFPAARAKMIITAQIRQ